MLIKEDTHGIQRVRPVVTNSVQILAITQIILLLRQVTMACSQAINQQRRYSAKRQSFSLYGKCAVCPVHAIFYAHPASIIMHNFASFYTLGIDHRHLDIWPNFVS